MKAILNNKTQLKRLINSHINYLEDRLQELKYFKLLLDKEQK